jgi:hypothetical protein
VLDERVEESKCEAERRKARVEVGVGILRRRVGVVVVVVVVVVGEWCFGVGVMVVVEGELVGWLVCGLIQYMYIYVYALLCVLRRRYVGMVDGSMRR